MKKIAERIIKAADINNPVVRMHVEAYYALPKNDILLRFFHIKAIVRESK